MTKSKYLITILLTAFLLILGGISWLAFFQDESEVLVEQQNQETSVDVEEQIQEEESPNVSAGVEVVPETSPTENTNPFEDTYKNPFE